jgi:proline iminopeptidase
VWPETAEPHQALPRHLGGDPPRLAAGPGARAPKKEATIPPFPMKRIVRRIVVALFLAVATILGSTFIKIYPKDFFFIERADAEMPVWVRGNTSSGTFLIYIHGGPGSSGIAEALFEVSPGDGDFSQESPLHALESDYAVVYWDQRNAGMSRGTADPNDSRIEDFGEDLALVVRTLRGRYPVRHLFLLGASWGHSVALSYLTLIDGWQDNQSKTDGYIVYKANHEADAPFQASKPKIVEVAQRHVSAGRDVAFWQAALEFYRQRPALTDPAGFQAHDEYATRAMGVSYPVQARAWAAFKASIFTPLNGWKFYQNNRRLRHADRFWSWVASDRTLSTTVARVTIPVMLVYGQRDLIAPPEVGRTIYAMIQTPASQKTMMILPNSRHGAEGPDVVAMQSGIRRFVEYITIAGRLDRPLVYRK